MWMFVSDNYMNLFLATKYIGKVSRLKCEVTVYFIFEYTYWNAHNMPVNCVSGERVHILTVRSVWLVLFHTNHLGSTPFVPGPQALVTLCAPFALWWSVWCMVFQRGAGVRTGVWSTHVYFTLGLLPYTATPSHLCSSHRECVGSGSICGDSLAVMS